VTYGEPQGCCFSRELSGGPSRPPTRGDRPIGRKPTNGLDKKPRLSGPPPSSRTRLSSGGRWDGTLCTRGALRVFHVPPAVHGGSEVSAGRRPRGAARLGSPSFHRIIKGKLFLSTSCYSYSHFNRTMASSPTTRRLSVTAGCWVTD